MRVAQRRPQPVRANKQGKSRQYSKTYATQNNPSEPDCGQGVVLCRQLRQAACQPGRGGASTPTAREGNGESTICETARWTRKRSASLAKFWTVILVEPNRDNRKVSVTFVAERQEAIEEAPMSGAWRRTGLHGV